MGILDLFKKSRYNLKEDEVKAKMQGAVIPKKEALESFGEPLPKNVVSTTINSFVVESSFKMPPLFVLSGTVRRGLVRKGMNATFDSEKLTVKELQFEFKKTSQLRQSQKGSLEVQAKLGLEVPNGTELRFFLRKDFLRASKPKKKKGKQTKREKAKYQKAFVEFNKNVVVPNRQGIPERTGLSDSPDSVVDDLARQ